MGLVQGRVGFSLLAACRAGPAPPARPPARAPPMGTSAASIIKVLLCFHLQAWPGYSACASYDYSTWFRVPTTYDKEAGVLSFTVICERVVLL